LHSPFDLDNAGAACAFLRGQPHVLTSAHFFRMRPECRLIAMFTAHSFPLIAEFSFGGAQRELKFESW